MWFIFKTFLWVLLTVFLLSPLIVKKELRKKFRALLFGSLRILIWATITFYIFSPTQVIMHKTTTHHGTEKHIDEETWVLVDLDNCLFQAPQGVAHTHYFEFLMKEAMDQGLNREEAFRKHYPTWVKAQETTHMLPLEESFIPYIQELQKKGITVMAITHRHPCTLDITKRQLNELSCHFSKRAPSKDSFALQYEDPAYYTDGILFVHDLNDKGEVFLSFCDKINKLPKKVLLYDDKLHNLESLQKALSTKEIPFTGIHYVAIDLKAPPLQEVTL